MTGPTAGYGAGSAPFGFLLRSLRLKSALTQMQLAERAGMSVRAVSALECGERRAPYRETVAALARALATSTIDAHNLAAAAKRGRRRSQDANGRAARASNIPAQLTTFIGRQHLLDAAQDRLTSAKFVVLTGRAGVGKTRMAIVLADRLAGRFADGTWLIDLSGAGDRTSVVAKTASLVTTAESRATDPSALAREIGERTMLLVLDNCERVAEACTALIVAIRNECPNVSIVATSIAPLGVESAATLVVDPLPFPAPSGVVTMDDVRAYASAELFIERCERYGYRFAAGNEVVPAISSICRRLEGLPLAIELAASRAASLGLVTLDATIARWLASSSGAFIDGPERHRSLFAAIDWSHDLLDDAERIAFRRLSVFAGSFEMAAAVAVCSAAPLDRASIPEIVLSLADKSLVNASVRKGRRHWSLFDSTRSYAATKLHAASEAHVAARAHAHYFANLYADGLARSYSTSSSQFLRSVHADGDEIDAAIAWGSHESGDPLIAARLLASLLTYWSRTGRVQRTQAAVDALLPRIDADAEPAAFAGLLLARINNPHGEAAVATGKRAVELFERCADPFGSAVAHLIFAHSLVGVRRCAEALVELDRSVARANAADPTIVQGTTRFAATVHRSRGEVFARAARWHEAAAEHTAALDVFRRLGDDFGARSAAVGLAEANFAIGDVASAIAQLAPLVREAQAMGDRFVERGVLANLAAYYLVLGETKAAVVCVRDALAIENDDPFLLVCLLQHAATVLALRERPIEAARLHGYVDEFRRATSFHRDFTEERSNAVLAASLAAQLPRPHVEALRLEGSSLIERAAIDIARAASA